MDSLYTIPLDSTSPFTEGRCDLCYQSHVKVKPLRCLKHSYCRMCQDFVPRLVKGDYNCTKCSTSYQKREAESLETVEKFLAEQTEVGNGEAARQEAVACRELLDRVGEVDDDDSDLEGGNQEWDHLLQSIREEEEVDTYYKSSATNAARSRMYSPPQKESSCREKFAPIPRKSSYMRLGFPTAGCVIDEQEPSTSKQPTAISNTVTELLNPPKYAVLPPYIPAHQVHRNSSSGSESSSRSSWSYQEVYADHSVETGKISSSSDNFLTDPDEQERGSSPCKVRRPAHHIELSNKGRRKPSVKTKEQGFELPQDLQHIDGPLSDSPLGHVEGPTSDSSDTDVSVDVMFNGKDSFWDV